jgi:hypothetical protein
MKSENNSPLKFRFMEQRMKSMRKVRTFLAVLSFSFSLTACGGGSSGSSGTLIEGTLTEAGGAAAAESRSLMLRHSSGQRIEDVQICALGECSTTDGEGQWALVTGDVFAGGEVLFTVKGHGIDTTAVVAIPNSAREVFVDFQHVEGGAIEAQHVTVDGETSHHEDDEHAHE